jgi:hypothetical protein
VWQGGGISLSDLSEMHWLHQYAVEAIKVGSVIQLMVVTVNVHNMYI